MSEETKPTALTISPPPSTEKEPIRYDVVLVGGSTSNFALAHRLLDLAAKSGVSFSMAILEKSREFGGHICSGAVVHPRMVKTLFPDYESQGFPVEGVCQSSHFSVMGTESLWHVPDALLPDGLKKHGYLILSLSHVIYWMATKLKEKAAQLPHVTLDLFPGFAAHEVVMEESPEGKPRVVGVQVVEQQGREPLDEVVYGSVVCFGDKGFVARQVIDAFDLRPNTEQIWSVGVKEVWQLPEDRDFSNQVWHTMGYPLTDGTFGGGFVYGMKNHKLTIGLIMSLDTPNPNLNPQQRLQDYKKHPWLQKMIAGGKLLKYGAALLPEGGFYSLPNQFAVDGAMLLGDSLGVLEVSQLNGVSNAMETGMLAADVIHERLLLGEPFTQKTLSRYKLQVMNSPVGKGLLQGRYFRRAWQENPRLLTQYLPKVMDGVDRGNPLAGILGAGFSGNPIQASADAVRLKLLMDADLDIGPIAYAPDHVHIDPDYRPNGSARSIENGFDRETLYSREDAVFYASTRYHEHNAHIDEFNADVCGQCITKYDALDRATPCVSDCTAEVHRVDLLEGLRRHGMSLENCIQCRTCEIVCPEENLRVRPTEQGSGPDFMGL
ncbi:MAG: electron transfer flavoprotein [Candidatus Melainabacteria bacterium]|nr:electron transfer flavoprotein [Candidatus Melainabacteria bacterium]